eukprot:10387130-Alexandrium_andersonii.AAC.1
MAAIRRSDLARRHDRIGAPQYESTAARFCQTSVCVACACAPLSTCVQAQPCGGACHRVPDTYTGVERGVQHLGD